jgi:hypothetical protein
MESEKQSIKAYKEIKNSYFRFVKWYENNKNHEKAEHHQLRFIYACDHNEIDYVKRYIENGKYSRKIIQYGMYYAKMKNNNELLYIFKEYPIIDYAAIRKYMKYEYIFILELFNVINFNSQNLQRYTYIIENHYQAFTDFLRNYKDRGLEFVYINNLRLIDYNTVRWFNCNVAVYEELLKINENETKKKVKVEYNHDIQEYIIMNEKYDLFDYLYNKVAIHIIIQITSYKLTLVKRVLDKDINNVVNYLKWGNRYDNLFDLLIQYDAKTFYEYMIKEKSLISTNYVKKLQKRNSLTNEILNVKERMNEIEFDNYIMRNIKTYEFIDEMFDKIPVKRLYLEYAQRFQNMNAIKYLVKRLIDEGHEIESLVKLGMETQYYALNI